MKTLWLNMHGLRKVMAINLLVGGLVVSVYWMTYLITNNQQAATFAAVTLATATFAVTAFTAYTAAFIAFSAAFIAFSAFAVTAVNAIAFAATTFDDIFATFAAAIITIFAAATFAIDEYKIKDWQALMIMFGEAVLLFCAMYFFTSSLAIILAIVHFLGAGLLLAESKLRLFIKTTPLPEPVYFEEKAQIGTAPYRLIEVVVARYLEPESLGLRLHRFFYRLYA